MQKEPRERTGGGLWKHPEYARRKCLQARGIRRVQILSLRRSLSYVIQGMANIESLNLSGCYNLTDNGLGHAFVQEIGSLRALNLSLCKQITDSSLGRIAQYLKGLEVLELGGCSNITNTGLLLIAWGLQRLKSLNLRSCRHLSDVGIGHLAGMTRSAAEGCLGLEQLTLQDCQKLTDLSLKHISRGLTGLRLLNLSFCGGISDAGLLHLSHMGSLRSLNLRSCDNISDTGIMHLAMGSLRLSGLDVSFCDKVGDQSLAYIAQGLDGLKSLSLCSCHISDDGINRMVRQMHGLRTLNIGQCVRITDKGLELIAEHLSQLTGIDLYGCTRITKRGLERITQLPCLKVLNLGLWQMTDSEKVRGGSDVAWWSRLYHLEHWVPWTKPLLPSRARGSRHESTRRGTLTSPANKIQVEFLHLLFVNPGKCTYFLKRRLRFFIISSLFHFV
eukprot:XP_028346676.1 F-box/LRR-repeat protein 14 isoform X2 [Physeter catodon]